MPRSEPVDGFSLAYERHGTPGGTGAPAVVLLHGWPGDRADWREVAPRLAAAAAATADDDDDDDQLDVIVPDLRGFGDSDAHPVDPAEAYAAAPQARSVIGLLDELGVGAVTAAGYDIGSRVAQQLARADPARVHGLVLAPPLPGVGERVLGPDPQREFWYQQFHRLGLPETLLDDRPDAVRAYLRHFWEHWSGPEFTLDEAALERLVDTYARPGRFLASIGWYRAGGGTVVRALAERPPEPAARIATPTTVLWPEHDPLFPRAWSDRLDEFFSDVTLEWLDGVGHFSPLEAPERFAAAIRAAARRGS